MEVKLTLHGILRDYLPRKARGKTTLDLPERATANDIVHQLKIKQNVSAAVGGVEVEHNYVLQGSRAPKGGKSDGIKVDREGFEASLDEYYRQNDWDVETGTPTRYKLEALDLAWVADDLRL